MNRLDCAAIRAASQVPSQCERGAGGWGVALRGGVGSTKGDSFRALLAS